MEARKGAVSAAQGNQERRNALAKEIGGAKKAKDEARAAALMAEVADLKAAEPALKAAQDAADVALADKLPAMSPESRSSSTSTSASAVSRTRKTPG